MYRYDTRQMTAEGATNMQMFGLRTKRHNADKVMPSMLVNFPLSVKDSGTD